MFRKLRRIFTFALAVALALIMGLEYPAQVSAESIPQYVKEIKMVTASTKEEAIKKLEDSGYTVCDYNIRDGLSGSVCYIGYIATTDESEAITDIRLMNAKGGITEEKYRDKKAKMTAGLASSTEYFKETCLELKSKYEAGSPLAAAAVGILNVFDFDGIPLSDYLFDSARTEADFEDIILICADNVVSAIYSALILGCADYGDSGNFAERLQSTDFSQFEYATIEDSTGSERFASDWNNVERILEKLQDFGTNYDLATAYFEDQDNIDYLEETYGSSDSSEEMTDAKQEEYWKQFVDDYFKDSEDAEEQELYTYANTLGAYEKLETYESPDSRYENLAEYFYACSVPPGKTDEATKKLVYSIYPLVESLTPGQIFTLQYSGVETLVNTLDNNTTAQSKKITAVTNEVKSKVQSSGAETVSIFYNVNRDIYDKTVCFTDEAEREAKSSSSYDQLTYVATDDETTQNLTKAVLICGMIAASLLAVTALAMSITAAIAGTTMATLLSVGFTAIMAGSIGVALGGMTLTTGAVVMGIIGVTTVVLALIFIAIIVICVIWMVIKKIKESNKDDDETMPSIPQQIYDVKGNEFICYDAVTDMDGNPVNYTCRDAVKEQWDVMYTTTSEVAGAPIEVNNGQIFGCYTDVTSVPSDSTPVKRFGATVAGNLNSFQSSPSHALYLAYNGSAAGQGAEEEEGDTEYVYSLSLASEDTAEAARLKLVNSGFTPIEQNITPYAGKVSYIGYKTTTNPNDAVTDIRIAYYFTGDDFKFGTTESGAAADYTKFGTLVTQASFYYTKQHSNGSPIYPDFKYTTELLSADTGYEPVNMFSGGDAFNLVNGSDNYSGVRCLDDNWNDKLYIYFKPSETFGTDSPEYLSGFAFSSGYDNCIAQAEMCGFKVVPVLSGYNLTEGLTEQPTYMLYSTTHNPYRAITEIRTYEAGNKATGLYENMVYGQVGFAACETFASIQVEGTVNVWKTYSHRLIRPSNGFITRLEYEGAVNTSLSDDLEAQNCLGYYDSVPMIGLYVAGPNANKTPLTFDDVYFSKSRYDTDRTSFTNSKGQTVKCRPVSDLTDCYSTSARNLTFEWAKRSYTVGKTGTVQYCATEVTFNHFLRMYYKGSVPVKGKYVKSIVVASVDPDDNSKNYSYDQAMAKLIANGEGEIKQVNLSRSSSSQPVTYSTYTDSNGKTVKRETVRDYTGKSTYVLVTYTDTLIGSLRSIVSDWNSDEVKKETKKLKYQGGDFYICGDKVMGQTGDYLLYSTSNGYFGSAVTDILISGDYLADGCLTVSAMDGSIHTGEDNAIKQVYDGSRLKGYVKNINVSFKGSMSKCYKELYEKGCTAAITEDKNHNLGGDYVVVGYTLTGDRTDPDIVTDIKVSIERSETSQSSYTDENTGMYYERITKDMNDDVGGRYTYLYVSKTRNMDPVTGLSSWHIMSENINKYTDYVMNNWTKTDNASAGTDESYVLVFTRMDYSNWTLSGDGTLTINAYGALPDYGENKSVEFPQSVWNDGEWETSTKTATVTYLPDWYECRESIRNVVVSSTVTFVSKNAFMGCSNIQSVRINNADCELGSYSIPDGATLYGYHGSWAEGYSANELYNVNFVYIESLSGTTMFGSGNVVVISGISFIMIVIGAAFIIVKKKKTKTNVIAESGDDTGEKEEP